MKALLCRPDRQTETHTNTHTQYTHTLFLLHCLYCYLAYFAVSLFLLDTLMLYNVAYLRIGMLTLTLRRCLYRQRHCYPHPRCTPPPSPGLLLCAEGNKDTRRISVVCLAKWLPETERAMPMGSTATPLSCAPVRRSPPTTMPGLP